MILKIVTIFLIVMFVLGLFGKLRVPGITGPKQRMTLKKPQKCAKCGRFLIGEAGCDCGRG